MASIYGIKTDFFLNEHQYFRIINGLPPDLAWKVLQLILFMKLLIIVLRKVISF